MRTALWITILLAVVVPIPVSAQEAVPGDVPNSPLPTLELPAEAAPRALVSEMQVVVPSGATFQVAKDWFISATDGRVTLQDPDRELTAIFLETTAAGGEEAIAASWKVVKPDFSRAPRHVMNPPEREGWDEIYQIVYETATEEERTVIGIGRRMGEVWYVALLDAGDAALDRRGAQLQTALSSFKAPGLEKESWAGRSARPLEAAQLEALAAFVDEARADSKVPGAAVAIVQNGRVVFERGFGVRASGAPDPVTPSSLFLIGSVTKSLTTLLTARLVDEGRLEWDRPLVEALPQFSLANPEITRQVTMKHTACACTGLPRQDMEFLFEYGEKSPENTVTSMASMTPTTGFGETFQYSNTMVSTGGYAAAHAAEPKLPLGAAYDLAMQTRIFEPLGMKTTTFDYARALAGDHAMPHGMDLSGAMNPIAIEYERALLPIRPAGGAWSNVQDMARYIQMELARGVAPGGGRLLSEEALLARREPQVKITDELSYGLGLFLEQNRGVSIIHHGGNTLGFTADFFFLPEYGIGAVALANAGGANAFLDAVRKRLLEILFEGKAEARDNLDYNLKEAEAMRAKVLEEVDFAPDPQWLKPILGAYEDPSLGKIEVTSAGAGPAVFDAGEWRSPTALRRGPDGVAKLILTGAPYAGIDFLPGEKDGKRTLTLDLAQQQYVFERRK